MQNFSISKIISSSHFPFYLFLQIFTEYTFVLDVALLSGYTLLGKTEIVPALLDFSYFICTMRIK